MHFRLQVLAVVLSVTVVACARADESTQRDTGAPRTTLAQKAGPGPEPCRVLTESEVTAIVNRPVAAGVPGSGTPPQSCRWPFAAGSREGDGVQIEVKPTATYAAGRQNKDAPVSQRVYDIEMVPGVGDEAFFQSSPQAGPDGTVVLAVLQDGRAYYITVRQSGLSLAQVRTVEVVLARTFLRRK